MSFMFRWRLDSSLEVDASLSIRVRWLAPVTVQFNNIANQ